jgi:hypothetical protein
MPKKGSKRAKKFTVKHDPNLLMLRWKALRDFSIKKFYITPIKHFQLDDNIRTLIERYVLPFGKAGTFMDLTRKLVYSWGYLTDSQKAVLREEWIAKGLPEELFDKIADKYNELQNFISQRPTTDMVLSWFLELEPYPQEAYVPKEEDQTVKTETEYETETAKITPYWKQEGHKEGFLLRKLVNVFKGRDKQLPEIAFTIQSLRSDLGYDFMLEIPAIAIREYELYVLLSLPNPSVITEMVSAEIERTLVISSMFVDSGVNTSWLETLYIILQTSNVFQGQGLTLTNFNAYVFSAYALAPTYVYLTALTISAEPNVSEGKVLINQIPNAYVEVQI